MPLCTLMICLQFGTTYVRRHNSNIVLSLDGDKWTIVNSNSVALSYSSDDYSSPLTLDTTCQVFFDFFFFVTLSDHKSKLSSLSLAVTLRPAVHLVWSSMSMRMSVPTVLHPVRARLISRVSIELVDIHVCPKCSGSLTMRLEPNRTKPK